MITISAALTTGTGDGIIEIYSAASGKRNGNREKPVRRQFSAVIAMLFVFMMTAMFCFPAAADSGKKQVIRAGFFAFDGYHMQDEDGRRSGYGYDFLQELSRYGDWTYTYVGYDKSWSEMLDMLSDGEISLLTSAQKTPEREGQFAFSRKPIGTSSAILTIKSGDTRFAAGKYSTYEGMRVGLLKGSSRNEDLSAFAEKNGFTYTAVYYGSQDEMADDLQTGNGIDAVFTSNLRSIKNEWILDRFDAADFYVIVRKSNSRLLSQINAAIDEMDANIPNWRNSLWDRYYTADTGNEIAFTAEEREYIRSMQESGTVIKAIAEPDRLPYSYFENGTAKGIIPEIFSRISAMTGLTFQIVETKTREEYFKTVHDDNGIDVQIDAYADNYSAEQAGYKLTSSYIAASVSAVTPRETYAEAKSIAMPKYANLMTKESRALKSGMKVTECNSMKECMDAVKNGKADTAYVLTYTAQDYLNHHDAFGRLSDTLLPQYSISYAVGVKASADIRLLSILDKAVNNLKSREVENIILQQTQTVIRDQSVTGFLSHNPWAASAVFLTIALIAGMAALLLYRQKNMQLIRIKNEELEKEARRADTANAAKSDFLSRMSHDMRTPLNVIIGITHLSLERDHTGETEDELHKIDVSSRFLLGLINDVLDMSKAESGKMTLHTEPYSRKEFTEYIDAFVCPLCEQKGLKFILDAEPVLDYVPLMDKLRANQVLFNLISNATKFTPEGGTVILRRKEHLTGTGKIAMEISVSDTGIGMSEDFQKKLFEPFTQEQRNDLSPERGTGLGLAIVKKIADLMGGTIRVESRPGKGTVFTLNAEFDCVPEEQVRAGNREDTADYGALLSGKHILLCEDHPLNQEIARALLEEKQVIVDIAENGQTGVQKFIRSVPGFYDVILMDIRMPVMDGFQATKEIRSLSRADAKTVPIIAMTADAYADDIQNCLNAGMSGHISKPVDVVQMYRTIASFIK
jgi:signal transduction histidine kinase